jgi:hypothetical protein
MNVVERSSVAWMLKWISPVWVRLLEVNVWLDQPGSFKLVEVCWNGRLCERTSDRADENRPDPKLYRLLNWSNGEVNIGLNWLSVTATARPSVTVGCLIFSLLIFVSNHEVVAKTAKFSHTEFWGWLNMVMKRFDDHLTRICPGIFEGEERKYYAVGLPKANTHRMVVDFRCMNTGTPAKVISLTWTCLLLGISCPHTNLVTLAGDAWPSVTAVSISFFIPYLTETEGSKIINRLA